MAIPPGDDGSQEASIAEGRPGGEHQLRRRPYFTRESCQLDTTIYKRPTNLRFAPASHGISACTITHPWEVAGVPRPPPRCRCLVTGRLGRAVRLHARQGSAIVWSMAAMPAPGPKFGGAPSDPSCGKRLRGPATPDDAATRRSGRAACHGRGPHGAGTGSGDSIDVGGEAPRRVIP